MKRSLLLTRGLCMSALLLMAAPALAEGKGDRAKEAMAAADAKVEAANKIGATGETPRLQAQAQAALRAAHEAYAAGHKEESIAQAIRATQLSDEAIGTTQKNRAADHREQRVALEATAAAAHEDAAAANARADAAQQSAAVATAQANAARASTPVVVAAPAHQATTVTTELEEHSSAAPRVTKRPVAHHVIHRQVRHTVTKRTRVTVSTKAN
ncbi:MAG: hypothetical protein JWL66_3011 [Sphingomonadales bacterium]|nr:hypothetical protein [Sphingomonadales bacterium]